MAGAMKEKGDISIWFFCGILTLVYGVVLVAQGVYDLGHPPATVLHELHPTLWWGALMTLAGGIYTVKFRPGKR
jgi:hypothetical protein